MAGFDFTFKSLQMGYDVAHLGWPWLDEVGCWLRGVSVGLLCLSSFQAPGHAHLMGGWTLPLFPPMCQEVVKASHMAKPKATGGSGTGRTGHFL